MWMWGIGQAAVLTIGESSRTQASPSTSALWSQCEKMKNGIISTMSSQRTGAEHKKRIQICSDLNLSAKKEEEMWRADETIRIHHPTWLFHTEISSRVTLGPCRSSCQKKSLLLSPFVPILLHGLFTLESWEKAQVVHTNGCQQKDEREKLAANFCLWKEWDTKFHLLSLCLVFRSL